MPKYLISWVEEAYRSAIVEADSAKEADAIFSSMDVSWERMDISKMQDSVEIEELNDRPQIVMGGGFR